MRSPYRAGWKAKARLFLAHNTSCVDCGAPSTDADHVIPRNDGGLDTWDNLEARCHVCHSRRTMAMHVRPLRWKPKQMPVPMSVVVGRW